MFENQTASAAPSYFHHQANTLFPKFLDNSFNNNKTYFGEPSSKFLDGSFNGNTTFFGSPNSKFMDGWFSNNNTTFGGKKN